MKKYDSISNEINSIFYDLRISKEINEVEALKEMYLLAERAKKGLMSGKNEVDNILKVDDIVDFN